MTARELYTEKVNENPCVTSIDLMLLFKKHLIEEYFCDGSPVDFEEMSIEQLKSMHTKVNILVDWVNDINI